jgi:hypothetical protein
MDEVRDDYIEDPDNPGYFIINPDRRGCLYCVRDGMNCRPGRGDSCTDRAIAKAARAKEARTEEIKGYVREVLIEEGII